MSWFKRIKEGITTSTRQKKETPEGLWHKCNNCKKIIPFEDHKKNYFVIDFNAISKKPIKKIISSSNSKKLSNLEIDKILSFGMK